MSEVLLEVCDLKKYFPIGKKQLHAVDGVSFTVEKGTTLGVVGESGCGKTTLGRTIIGLTKATSGQVLFEGRDITLCNPREMRALRKDLQIIFQDPYSSLDPRRTIGKNIEEPILLNTGEKSRTRRAQRIEELMELVGLPKEYADAYPFEVDSGRLQRAGIARAISVNPKLIICDEPVSSLDVSIQAQILNLLMDLQEQLGFTYIFITHDLSVVHHISKQIAVMYLGECVEFGSRDQIFKNPTHPYTRSLLSAIPIPGAQERERKMELIRGEIASAVDPGEGCRFAPRCPYATEACNQKVDFVNIGDGHRVACILKTKENGGETT